MNGFEFERTMRALARLIAVCGCLALSAGLSAQERQELPPAAGPMDGPVYGPVAGPVYGPTAAQPAPAYGATPAAIPDPLDLAARIAANTHPLVDAATAESSALDAELRGARFRRYPSVSVEALLATEGSSFSDQDGFALNATLEQPLWTAGRINNEIDRARASSRVGRDRIDEAERDIVLRVVAAYYDYVLAAERVTVLEASLVEHNELLAAIGRRVAQEVSPRSDYTLGLSRTAQVELDLASTMEARDTALIRLTELTGGVEVDPQMPPPGVSRSLPAEEVALADALGCSPSLAALTNLITVAEEQRDIAYSSLWPQLLLQVSQNEITGTRAAVVLRAQLGPGNAQLRAVEAGDARITRALAEFSETERVLREQLRRDYVLVRAAERRIEAGVLATDAADQIIASYQRQFIAGRRSWLDVMNAVREAANARLSESDARVSAAAATARILALSCRWQPEAGVGAP
ncbi:TolC family protein [Erythrobacter sp. EC-HK427]|uniref:TolC family protein n=1 Tax=Erythrobacter sp. EC-HK427 TaxID=2038396 RepID=UPI0018FEC318|nr:TolC family protein [Erythrobacter sp. EC-HK427]